MFKMNLQNLARFKNLQSLFDITLSVAHRASVSAPKTVSIKEIIEMIHLGMKSQMSKKVDFFSDLLRYWGERERTIYQKRR